MSQQAMPISKRKLSYLKTVRILIIGDIHFPDNSKPYADKKDSGFPETLSKKIFPQKLSASIRAILKEQKKEKFDFHLFVGDLTSRADQHGYKQCITFLLQSVIRRAKCTTFIVPGNHDIERASYDEDDSQYKTIETILRENKFTCALPIKQPLNTSNEHVEIWRINSCVGCGAQRAIPDSIKFGFKEGPFAFLKNLYQFFLGRTIAILDQKFEILDTPAFKQADMEYIVNNMDSKKIPIILTHHNLLPQVTSRPAIYTELVNGGYFRSLLQSAERDVFYVHGHNHAEAIEVISNPKYPGSKIICVGAYDLPEGFDILNLHISGYDECLIGCSIEQFRSDASYANCTQRGDKTHIQMARKENRQLPPEIVKLLSRIKNDYTPFGSISIPDEELLKAQQLEELYWRGLVDIRNFNLAPSTWHIKRISYG